VLKGDFKNDGTVNGSDYTLIDNAFNSQGANIAAIVALPMAVVNRTGNLRTAVAPSTVPPNLFQSQAPINAGVSQDMGTESLLQRKDLLDVLTSRN